MPELTIQKNEAATHDKPWFQYIVDLSSQNFIDSAFRAFLGEIIVLMAFPLFVD